MTSTDTRVDIFSAAERAEHLATSLTEITDLIARPLTAGPGGEAIDPSTIIQTIRAEVIDAAFTGRPDTPPAAIVAAMIDRMQALYLIAGSIEQLAADIAMHLGADLADA